VPRGRENEEAAKYAAVKATARESSERLDANFDELVHCGGETLAGGTR